MRTPVITWDTITSLCPREASSVSQILDEYDIQLIAFMQGVAGQLDWHDVVDLHDCHLEIGDLEEARTEDDIISRLQKEWASLARAFETATAVDGAGLRIADQEIVFEENEMMGGYRLSPSSSGTSTRRLRLE